MVNVAGRPVQALLMQISVTQGIKTRGVKNSVKARLDSLGRIVVYATRLHESLQEAKSLGVESL